MHTIRLPMDKGLVGPLVLVEWLKQEGQSVGPTEPLARMEAAGTLVELQAGVSGTLLKALAGPGQVLEPGDPVGVVEAPGQDVRRAVEHLLDSGVRGRGSGDQGSGDRRQGAGGGGRLPEGVVPILMPQAGQTMEEGTLVAWKVKPGDRIEVGQVIFDIETDKATMEVEAPDAGRIARIVVQEGQVVPVKTPVAYLAESDAEVEAYLRGQGIADQGSGARERVGQSDRLKVGGGAATEPGCAPHTTDLGQGPEVGRQERPAQAQVAVGGRVKASPAARKVAAERGIDLAALGVGSGPGGRIISSDVAAARPGAAPESKGPSLSKMRLAIARNLLWSKQNIPHFYAKRGVEAQALFTIYRRTKEQFRCTINDFVTAACARAIREFPGFRSQFKDNAIVEFPYVNIGIAVGTDQGLTVPVVLNADRMDLQALSQKTRQVAENARAGRLEGVGQGVFTITNLGMFGVEEFLAIINPPESAILAVGAFQETVRVQDGCILPSRTMALCLSVDHRVIDGIMSAQFLNRVKELLESPEQLIHL